MGTEWKNDVGEYVDDNGRGNSGTYYSQHDRGSHDIAAAGFMGKIFGIGIIIFLLLKLLEWVKNNWIVVAVPAALLITCLFVLRLAKRKLTKVLVLLLSIGLTAGVIRIGHASIVRFFTPKNNNSIVSNPVIEDVSEIKKYISEDIHLQDGPSWSHNSLGILTANTEVIVSDDEISSDWTKIKYNDLEGYVESKYLKESRY